MGGARTPIGKYLGALSTLSSTDLGGLAIAAALRRAGVDAAAVDEVILGQVLLAGVGQMPARQAAVKAGIPMTVPATTVNKVCLSGLHSIAIADAFIRAGHCEVVVAGGMESMSQAPHLIPRARQGIGYGDATLVDSLSYDALFDVFTDQSMGALTESCNTGESRVSREDQDAFAARSHRLAARAEANGEFDEIEPVSIPQRRGEPLEVRADEGVRPDTTAETLAKLRPAFDSGGSITAGSASQISDGAAAVLVMSERAAERLGCQPWARVGAYAQVAGPDSSLQLQPERAIREASEKAGVSVGDFDLYEINEAFAAVGVASSRALGLSEREIDERVNVHGGAIALGHPVGASGARLALHLASLLRRGAARRTVAALCGGGGQGDALVLEAL